MSLPNAVANPIVNDPFAPPTHYYDFSSGAPILCDGRRPATCVAIAPRCARSPSRTRSRSTW